MFSAFKLDSLPFFCYNIRMNKDENTTCTDCDEIATENSEFCDECAYEHGQPIEPWRPDPREDGGYFGGAGYRD